MVQKQELWFDVVVIGGGGAALRAALSACENGSSVALISKGETGRSGATYHSVAEVGAFNVPDGAMDSTDSPEAFYQDMEDAALGTARLPLCELLARQAEDALWYLEEISGGQVFSKADGKFRVYQACFSKKPRSHVVENHFKPVLRALRQEIQKRGITVLNGFQAVELLLADGEVGGVLVLDESGEEVVMHAKSVVLAAGGASRLFRQNMYPADITGDGYAMAYRAGAQLSNLEFIQAGIGTAYPFINLFGNYLWKAYPVIQNVKGERILRAWGESAERKAIEEKTHFPFSTRDASKRIEIAVQTEINQGHGTEHGNMLLCFPETDFQALFQADPVFEDMWKITYQLHKEKGINLYRQPMEIACFAHAINGGVLINEQGASSVPGLYAAGETAAGPHGADRLGGNMSVTCQVFGKIAGQFGSERAKAMKAFPQIEAAETRAKEQLRAYMTGYAANWDDLLDALQRESDRALLIVREEKGLLDYQSFLRKLHQEIERGCTPAAAKQWLQVRNLAETGEMIAAAALERRESRGSHYRADYPNMDPKLGKMLLIQKAGEREISCHWAASH